MGLKQQVSDRQNRASSVIKQGHLASMLGYHLRRAQEASFAAYAWRVGDDHIWPGWYAMLAIIHENPEINQTMLSEATGRDKSTLTSSLRQLVHEGLVERKRDKSDARSYILSLTLKGQEQLALLQDQAIAHERDMERILGHAKTLILIEILNELHDGLART